MPEGMTAKRSARQRRIKLLKVSDASGTLTTEQVGGAKLKRDMLDSSETFVLDTGSALFVWVGKQASREEKSQAFITANTFLLNNERPAWTPVSLVIDQGETAEFKSYFFAWDPPAKPRDWRQPKSRRCRACGAKEIDVASLPAGM